MTEQDLERILRGFTHEQREKMIRLRGREMEGVRERERYRGR